MKRIRPTACLVVPALAILLTIPALAQDMGQTVATACSKCHNTQRVCANLGVKDKAAWDATVSKMISKGAQVAEKDKPAVVDWLASQKAGAKPVCN